MTINQPIRSTLAKRRLAAAAAAVAAALATGHALAQSGTPIVIERQGAFAVGGKVLGDPATASLHCDHGVVEYQIPPNPRAVNLLMWHSASAVAWQNRWDGGEGFQSIFVRRGFPVYLWDGPRVGRADWGCADTTYEPGVGRDQQNFVAWRLGTAYPEWFDGVQFPTDDPEAWNQATRARYQEFDTVANAQLQSDAAAALADRIGPTVALTNSAGGLRALLTAMKSDNIKGIVAYENVGYVYPPGEGPGGPEGPFGPIEVSLEDFRKLTRIPMQMVWGDNVAESERYGPTLEESRRFVELVNEHGGNAEVLVLSEAGLTGNTHIPFADLNNVEVADLLSKFLSANGLDASAGAAAAAAAPAAAAATAAAEPVGAAAPPERDYVFTDAEGHMVLRFAGTGSSGLNEYQLEEIVNVQLSTMVHERLRADAVFDAEPVDPAWADSMEAKVERHVRSAAPEFARVEVECRSASCRLVLDHPNALRVAEHQALMNRAQLVVQKLIEAEPASFKEVFLISAQYQEPAKPFTKLFLQRAEEES